MATLTTQKLTNGMLSKQRLKRLAFWGIMMACMGVSVFDNQVVGQVVCFTGLGILIMVKVMHWKNRQKSS